MCAEADTLRPLIRDFWLICAWEATPRHSRKKVMMIRIVSVFLDVSKYGAKA